MEKEIKASIKLYVLKDYSYKVNIIFVTNYNKVYCFGNNSDGF